MVFDHHPILLYFHFARTGDGKMDRHLSLNGVRWEDVDFWVHATDFEYNRKDSNPIIEESIHAALQASLPDYKALRVASEELFHALADLTSQGVFNLMGDGTFRLIVTREGVSSYKTMNKEEARQYPSQASQG